MVARASRAWPIALSLAVGACAPILGLDFDRALTVAEGAAGTGGANGGASGVGGAGGATGAGGGGAPCVLATPPKRPAQPGGDGTPVVVAMTSIDLGDAADAASAPGFDIDGVCTGDNGTPSACKRPSWSSKATPVDGPGGRDNAFLLFVEAVGKLYTSISSKSYSDKMGNGEFSVLLRVGGYDGQDDDGNVTLEWIPAPFPKNPSGAWPVPVGVLDPNQNAITRDDMAYVRDRRVVASLKTAVFSLPDDLDLELADVSVVATLTGDVGGFRLTEGVVSGKLTMAAAFKAIAGYYSSDLGYHFCAGTQLYNGFKKQLCDLVDLGPPGSDCDTFSVGFAFETGGATIGDTKPRIPPKSKCGSITDPSNDTCICTNCGTSCVDTTRDPNNCGSCGKTCDAGVPCSHGACGCNPGEKVCQDGCLACPMDTDTPNCGALRTSQCCPQDFPAFCDVAAPPSGCWSGSESIIDCTTIKQCPGDTWHVCQKGGYTVDCGPPWGCVGGPCSPGFCKGTDGQCHGNCSGTSKCTLDPIGTCSAPSAGGVYCCTPPVIAKWQLNGTISSNNPFPVTTKDANVAGSGLAKSAALGVSTFANAFVAAQWPTGPLDPTKYLEFSVTASAGHVVSYQEVHFSLYNNFDGAASWEIRSSVDSFGGTLATGTVAAGITDAGYPVTAKVGGLTQLAGKVSFRLYTFDNSGVMSPTTRGLRGSGAQGQDLEVWGVVQ